MRMFLAAIFAALFLIFCNAYAYSSGVICFGADLKESEKQEILSLLNSGSNITKISITADEENGLFPGGDKQGVTVRKSVVYAYVNNVSENQGIKVNVSNVTYVTPEMIAESMITAGIKDVEVKTGGPYEISGYSSLPAIMKAYEGLTGNELSGESKLAGCRELQEMGILGLNFGMQKSVQFINEVEMEVLKKQEPTMDDIKNIITNQGKRFNIDLDDNDMSNVIYVMSIISHSGLKDETIKTQQKNISHYLNDQTNTVNKSSIIKIIIDKILFFLKKISLIFTGNGD